MEIQKEVHAALADLQREVIPSKRRLHQLENYKDPKIHTIDVPSNHSYKISLEIDGATATLRRVATHKTIDQTGAPTSISTQPILKPAMASSLSITPIIVLMAPRRHHNSHQQRLEYSYLAGCQRFYLGRRIDFGALHHHHRLSIRVGVGTAYAFGDSIAPRIWNGTITYSATAVPEPETYGMLLGGLALMGLVARRRQNKA